MIVLFMCISHSVCACNMKNKKNKNADKQFAFHFVLLCDVSMRSNTYNDTCSDVPSLIWAISKNAPIPSTLQVFPSKHVIC